MNDQYKHNVDMMMAANRVKHIHLYYVDQNVPFYVIDYMASKLMPGEQILQVDIHAATEPQT